MTFVINYYTLNNIDYNYASNDFLWLQPVLNPKTNFKTRKVSIFFNQLLKNY